MAASPNRTEPERDPSTDGGNGTITGVEPVAAAVGLLAVLLGIGVAFAWQERRPADEPAVVYGVEDAIEFVMGGLSDESRQQVRRRDVRRILEWEMRYLQDPTVHGGEVPVVGGIEAARYAQEHAMRQGHAYDGAVIIEVLDLEAVYLAALGAIGPPVEDAEVERISAIWAEGPAGDESAGIADEMGDPGH